MNGMNINGPGLNHLVLSIMKSITGEMIITLGRHQQSQSLWQPQLLHRGAIYFLFPQWPPTLGQSDSFHLQTAEGGANWKSIIVDVDEGSAA